jgi:pimeloyl-ACP methyl ester carboxylesterase
MIFKRLILIHGFTERPSMWNELIAGLELEDIAISTPSIPGHGDHPDILPEKTARAYCEAIINQIPNDSLPWIVVGHSMGGYLASSLVADAPNQINALGFFHSKASADNQQKIDDRKRAIEAATQNKDLYLATMLRNTLAERSSILYADELAQMIECAKADITTDCIAASHEVMIERPDNTEFLSKADFPIYYFLGSEDKSIPYEQVKHEINSISGAHVTLIENVGHMGHLECKEEALAWLRSVCQS